jgi:hypothetical protein
MILAMIALAGSIMDMSSKSRSLGTTIGDASRPCCYERARPSDASPDLTAKTQAASDKTVAWPFEPTTTVPSITSFSATPKSRFYIAGDSYYVQDAGKSYSLTKPDPQTLRFEIRPGDNAWFDEADGEACNRAEISGSWIALGTPVNMDFLFMSKPNGANGAFTNTAPWFVIGELHNDDGATRGAGTSPPFASQLDRDHLQVVARYCPTGLNPSNRAHNLTMLTPWTDPKPIQTGRYNAIRIQANVSNSSMGYLDEW